MIYQPTIDSDFEYWRAWELLFKDPVLYAWMYWEVANARENLRPRLEFKRIDDPAFADTVLWRAGWGFSGNRNNWSPFVVPTR